MTTLRQEIMDKIGPSRPPTTCDLKEMRYLRAVLDGETIPSFLMDNKILTELVETLRYANLSLSYDIH